MMINMASKIPTDTIMLNTEAEDNPKAYVCIILCTTAQCLYVLTHVTIDYVI